MWCKDVNSQVIGVHKIVFVFAIIFKRYKRSENEICLMGSESSIHISMTTVPTWSALKKNLM